MEHFEKAVSFGPCEGVKRLKQNDTFSVFLNMASINKTEIKSVSEYTKVKCAIDLPPPNGSLLFLCAIISIILYLSGIVFQCVAQEIRFRDVSREIGINVPGAMGACCAFADYNNDGYLDILFNPGSSVYLFRNNNGFSFTDVTDAAGLTGYRFRNLVWADYNNDGHLDVLAGLPVSAIYLFRNNGNGTFTDVRAQLGLPDSGTRPLLLDYNRDGLLDILIISSSESRLYKQTDTNFTLVYTFVGGNAGTCFDYDNDLDQDVYICRNGANKLYRNNGDGTWTDVTTEAGVGNTGNANGAVSGDFNNDGNLDLYVANLGGSFNVFYINQGNGTFLNRTSFYSVGDVSDGRTCDMIDFNNDRLLDIFTTNHVYANRLYKNLGYNIPFFDVAGQVGIAYPHDIFAASWGDFDNDGDLDAFLTGHSAGGYALMRDSGGNHLNWLKVKLQGTRSNRAGIGCRVYLFINDTMQLVELSGGSGQYGHNSLIAHFGTGQNTSFDSLIVLWTSTARTTILSGNTNNLISITEPLVGIDEDEPPLISISPRHHTTTFIDWRIVQDGQQVAIFDAQGRQIRRIDRTGVYFLLERARTGRMIIKKVIKLNKK